MRMIDAPTLKAWIRDGQELAILDAREEGEFGQAHLFWANPCPLSRAELRARAILPRLGTRICCVDGGAGGLAARLAAYLESIGASDVAVLEGGTPAWGAAGYVVFSGVNVPSKAFGEWVEHHYATPSVDPEELQAMIASGTDMVILDSRPMDEFRRMSIPGAIDVPGGELVYRIGELAPRPETTVVVNCAGRTRSIMGAESLRSAGVPNKVVALRNGTMGWELAGFACDRGREASYPRGVPAALPTALARATAFAERSGVRTIPHAALGALRADPTRTTYLLDVRDPEEFAAGHLPGSLNAPGGQLVQATDRWVAVRGARIVLVDGNAFGAPLRDGVRARMAGGWLRQMGGWEVFVLEDAQAATAPLERRSASSQCPEAAAVDVQAVGVQQLDWWIRQGEVTVLQITRSTEFRERHVPTAIWGVRTRLGSIKDKLSISRRICIVASLDDLARLSVPEVRALAPSAEVYVLGGAFGAWVGQRMPTEADRHHPEDAACIDAYLRPYDRNSGIEAAMRAYLSWEIDLVHEVEKDGDARFGAVLAGGH